MHNNIIRNASSLYTVHHFTSVIFAACNRNRLINVSFQIYLRNTLNMPRSDLCAPTPGSVHRFRVKQPIVMVLIPLNACGDFSYKTRCPRAVEHRLNCIFCFNTCTSFAENLCVPARRRTQVRPGWIRDTYVRSVRLSYLCIKILFLFQFFTICSEKVKFESIIVIF